MTRSDIGALLRGVEGRSLDEDERVAASERVAELLLERALAARDLGDRIQARRLGAMMEDPPGRLFTTALCDRAFRSERTRRVAEQLRHLLRRYGVPRYLGPAERLALTMAGIVSRVVPDLVVPALVANLRAQTGRVIVPAGAGRMRSHLRARRAQGVRLNLNQLGEAILGEEEAERRLERYLALLARDDVDYVSVKISSISSLIQVAAFERTVAHLAGRLRRLYRAALPQGKFVNLDMEEYRDLALTVAAFTQVLDEDEFLPLSAGIVLQAYVPDSAPVLEELTVWARARRARGGAPIKVRIVKGANLQMERVEASQHGWVQAPYATKHEVDANFKRLLHRAFTPERCDAVRIGLASHNLFDVAYGLVLRAERGVADAVIIEMLEGMANHQARAVRAAAGGLLLYLPVVEPAEFRAAIAYLVRRLDENTGAENFLRAAFAMRPGSEAWRDQAARFRCAVAARDAVAEAPRRAQDRRVPAAVDEERFANAADTDWTTAANRAWLARLSADWCERELGEVPLVVAGEERRGPRWEEGLDPSAPETPAYRYAVADAVAVEDALAAALTAQREWDARPIAARRAVLLAAARALEAARDRLAGAAMRDAGKTVVESDAEISEAIDFAAYYARGLDDELLSDGARPQGRGVVVVAPPWNFPLSIPAGGCLAALMAGNAVILKPAPEAVRCAWELVQVLWSAGIPRELLQFVPTREDADGRRLISDPRVASVILTGATATARLFASWRDDLRVCAETGGKNALVVGAMADRDQAIKDLVASAFGHAGQKCSAASLAILEAEVYDDASFLSALRDAAESLPVGGAEDPWHRVTPLVRAPGPELQRALTRLDPGESWLLAPRRLGERLWTPGIRLGVAPGGFFHRTECFGPVLGLMRARDLDHAIQLQNAVPYGLTGGIHSLDEREQRRWCEQVEVGNAYVNRGITGAVVQRQPFGGWKASSVGPGAKAGGPHYVAQFARWAEDGVPRHLAAPLPAQAALLERLCPLVADPERIARAAGSQAAAWRARFARSIDRSRLRGESNVLRYRPPPLLLLRATVGSGATEVAIALLAAACAGLEPVLSAAPETLPSGFPATVEHAEGLIARFAAAPPGTRLRLLGHPESRVQAAAAAAGVAWIDDPVVATGALELRHYLREQSISLAYHRYGNPGDGPPRWLLDPAPA